MRDFAKRWVTATGHLGAGFCEAVGYLNGTFGCRILVSGCEPKRDIWVRAFGKRLRVETGHLGAGFW